MDGELRVWSHDGGICREVSYKWVVKVTFRPFRNRWGCSKFAGEQSEGLLKGSVMRTPFSSLTPALSANRTYSLEPDIALTEPQPRHRTPPV